MTTATLTRPKPARQGKERKERDPNAPTPAEAVANRIIELLDQGHLPPWKKGWRNSSLGYPQNAVSKKAYRGINYWLTLMTQVAKGYQDPRWLTFNQAKDLGGNVRKGEKSTAIIFWKIVLKTPKNDSPDPAIFIHSQDDEETPTRERFPMARMYHVFNAEQAENCNLPELDLELKDLDPITEAEAIIAGMPNPPAFETYATLNNPPHYIPALDVVRVPEIGRYNKTELYYNTVFHELTHATSHPTRLNRDKSANNTFQSHDYGVEELVAGMGAAMLADMAGIGNETLEADASYIRHWRDTIAADKSIVLKAAQQAQRAVDYIIPPHQEESSENQQ